MTVWVSRKSVVARGRGLLQDAPGTQTQQENHDGSSAP
jgi:hypothetical protein